MSPFDRDSSKHGEPSGDGELDASATRGSNADAEDSAAHIADLVRRTAERQAGPRPFFTPGAEEATQRPPAPMTAPGPDTPESSGHSPSQPGRRRNTHPPRPVMHRPSRPTMVLSSALATALIAGALALSHSLGSDAGSTPPAQPSSAPAPPGYAVQVTDQITDCASHARGQTKSSFESQDCVKATRLLATGQVSGRPTLFVVSRIQMPSPEAAATMKQVLDGPGTGNLNDLLREGRTFPGSPAAMTGSGYNSMQSGTIVTVAEAGFVDKGRSSNTDPSLRAAAAQVAALVGSQG